LTRLDRLARSTRDLLNALAAITAKKAGFRSLGDAWADTTTSHGAETPVLDWRERLVCSKCGGRLGTSLHKLANV
jgi:hypothetical protein